MNAPIKQWHIDELGTLDDFSFRADAPAPGGDSYSVAFWFRADNIQRIQVLCNQGAMSEAAPGWTFFLRDNALHFSVADDYGQLTTVSLPVPGTGRWLHTGGVINRERGELCLYLTDNNVNDASSASKNLPAASITSDPVVIVGGYTDPAGGHFDHTFGRGGDGYLNDLRLYDRALKADEFIALAHPDSPVKSDTLAFTIDAANARAPLTIRFDASASDAEMGVRACLWDFGDGMTGIGMQVEHDYLYAGDYSVCLTIIHNDYSESVITQELTLVGEANPLHIRPVFVNGTEGYACYRIPAIVCAADGSLVAFAEGRVESCSDSTPTIHIVSKRSTDNGHTWGPVQAIARNIIPKNDVIEAGEYVAQNVSAVVDQIHGTGRIVIVYKKHEHSEWDRARGIGVSRAFCAYSDDNGITWHGERDITAQVHRPYNPSYAIIAPAAADKANQLHDWRIHVPSLGHAIQLRGTSENPRTRGRLFFAGSYTSGAVSVFRSHSFAFWSDDLGETWRIGGTHDHEGLNESTAVELEDGHVMFNHRAYHGDVSIGCRAVTVAAFDANDELIYDTTTYDQTLIDPAVQGGIIRYTWRDQSEYGGASRILFSNPNHPRARLNLTIRLSYDEGRTWTHSKTVDRGPSSYSDLVIQSDMRIGMIYERGNQGGIAYVDFNLEWLTGGADRLTAHETDEDS